MRTFNELLFDFANAGTDAGRQAIDDELHERFGRTGAVYVLDMAGFSRVTQSKGIVYYLSLVRRMQIIVEPIIEGHGGQVVKFEADNCFATLPTVVDAIRAAIAINHAVGAASRTTPEEFDIVVAGGISYGEYLLIDEKDYWGDVVNLASKLGEDIAKPGEILVTAAAMAQVGENAGIECEPVSFSISGLRLDACRVRY